MNHTCCANELLRCWPLITLISFETFCGGRSFCANGRHFFLIISIKAKPASIHLCTGACSSVGCANFLNDEWFIIELSGLKLSFTPLRRGDGVLPIVVSYSLWWKQFSQARVPIICGWCMPGRRRDHHTQSNAANLNARCNQFSSSLLCISTALIMP